MNATMEQVYAVISAAPQGLTLAEIVDKVTFAEPVASPHVATRSALKRLRLSGRAAVTDFADGVRRWRKTA